MKAFGSELIELEQLQKEEVSCYTKSQIKTVRCVIMTEVKICYNETSLQNLRNLKERRHLKAENQSPDSGKLKEVVKQFVGQANQTKEIFLK